jgi:predicted unusual protein kinase regulating ubiquinone biosynthesis (AarF/ABC1/UbiB family)
LWCAHNNNDDDDDNRSADRLLRLFQQNKGIYVKAGQHISSLDYILPYVITPRPSYSIPSSSSSSRSTLY